MAGLVEAENTQLLCKGKYHCVAHLLFDRLGFGQTSKIVYSFNSTKQQKSRLDSTGLKRMCHWHGYRPLDRHFFLTIPASCIKMSGWNFLST